MKTAIIIFVSGLVGLVCADYFGQLRPYAEIYRQQTDHPLVVEHIKRMSEVVDLSTEAVITREVSVGYIDHLVVHPGFRVTHNPDLGREVVVTAPEKAFGYLRLNGSDGGFAPDFTRPVRLAKRVEIELNLEAHGSKQFGLSIRDPYPGRTTLPPDFVTKGPLSFQLLFLSDIPDHKIEIKSKDVVIKSNDDASNLYGVAERVELLFAESGPTPAWATNLPNMRYQELYNRRSDTDTRGRE